MHNKFEKRKYIYILLLLIICIFIFLINNIKIPCMVNSIFGIYCPGCGITRMFISIVKLDFYQAFRYNPMVFLLLPFFIFYGILEVTPIIYKKDNILNNTKFKFIWIILIVIVILFGILRNIEMFNFLAPTKIS